MKLTPENKVTIQIVEKALIFMAISAIAYIGNNIAGSLEKYRSVLRI